MNGITFQREQGGLGRRAEGEDHVSALLFYGAEATHLPELLDVYSLEDAERSKVSMAKTPIIYYHIAEFFRVAEAGSRLFVRAKADDKYDGSFAEVKQMQQHAAGAIRQVGVWVGHRNITADVANLNKACEELAAMNMPLSAVVAYRLTSEELKALPNLGANVHPRVSVCIAQDGGGLGAFLFKKDDVNKPAITAIGACMGAIARAKVHESIAWVEKQNMVNTTYGGKTTADFLKELEVSMAAVDVKMITKSYTKSNKDDEKLPIQKKIDELKTLAKELDVATLVDGTLMTDLLPTDLDVMSSKRYLFLRKHVGQSGSYWNDSFTADKPESDYGYIENNRTIDKAVRGIYKALLPHLSGPVRVDASTGKISVGTITFLETLAEDTLVRMERDGELSGFNVIIDPNQSILGTSKLAVVVKLIPVGVLREIKVSIGFTVKIEE